MDLFTLAAKLTLDSSSFSSGVSQAESQGNKLSSILGKITSAAKKVASALVFKKGIESLKSLADKASAAGDAIDKGSQKLGISRQAYQEWEYILSQCGSSIDSMGTAMKTLNSKILSGDESVQKLGMSLEDLGSMSMEQQLEAVVRAFQEMPEGAEKSALAVELFGKQGMELLPLLNSSSDTLDTLRQRFNDLGIAMSDDMIDSAVNYTDAMDTMQRTLEAAGIAIGAELLPTLTEWVTKATNFAGEILSAYKEGGLEGVFETLNAKLSTLIENLKTSDSPFLQFLGSTLETIQTALTTVYSLFTDFKGTVAEMKASDSLGVRLLGTALELVQSAFQWVMDNKETVIAAVAGIIAVFEATKIISFVTSLNPLTIILGVIAAAAAWVATNWDTLKEAVSSAIETISQWWGSFKDSAVALWEEVMGKAESIWQSIKQFITEPIESAKSSLQGLWNQIQLKAKSIWDEISATADSIWKSIEKFISDPIGSARDSLNKIWVNIRDAAKRVWDTILDWISPVVEGVVSVINTVSTAVQGVIDWFKQLMGYDGKNLASTTSSHTHTTYQRVVNASGEEGWNSDSDQSLSDWYLNNHHAKGAWNIPYNDYPALLHRGEMVLTASQARRYRDGEDEGVSGAGLGSLSEMIVAAIRQGMEGVTVNSYLDGREVTDTVSRQMGSDLSARRYATA